MYGHHKSVQQSGTFVLENDRNVHECGTKVPTLCTDSECEKMNEIIENKEDSPGILAYAHVKEKREEKNREEYPLPNPPQRRGGLRMHCLSERFES